MFLKIEPMYPVNKNRSTVVEFVTKIFLLVGREVIAGKIGLPQSLQLASSETTELTQNAC